MNDQTNTTEATTKKPRNKTWTNGNSAGIDFAEGGRNSVDLSEVPSEVVQRLALKAAKDELGAAAREDGPDGVAQTIQRMHDGFWTDMRVTNLARAVARHYGVDEMAAAAKLADMTDAEQETIRKHEAISAILTELTLENKRKKAANAEALPDLF